MLPANCALSWCDTSSENLFSLWLLFIPRSLPASRSLATEQVEWDQRWVAPAACEWKTCSSLICVKRVSVSSWWMRRGLRQPVRWNDQQLLLYKLIHSPLIRLFWLRKVSLNIILDQESWKRGRASKKAQTLEFVDSFMCRWMWSLRSHRSSGRGMRSKRKETPFIPRAG